MKNKLGKIILIVLVSAIVVAIISGCSGNGGLTQGFQEAHPITLNTIAVVNADMGVEVGGQRLNYSAAIIDALDMGFVLVSPAMAESGFESGAYGAVIMFPADVSENIVSFNTQRPERVQLEFRINPNLLEADYIDMHIRIMNLQVSINTTLAHTYVSSIYMQFHRAQDQLDVIFSNNESNLASIDTIRLPTFSSALNLGEMPNIPLETESAETASHMTNVSDFAENVVNLYVNSYAAATENYLHMREGLFNLIDGLSDEENDWMLKLIAWTVAITEFGDDITEYTDSLTVYAQTLHSLHDIVGEWFEDAGVWYSSHKYHFDGAVGYLADMTDYIEFLFNNVEPASVALQEWYNSLRPAFGLLRNWHDNLLLSFEVLQEWHDDMEPAWEKLQTWHRGLSLVYDELHEWQKAMEGSANDSIDDLKAWQNNLNNALVKLKEWKGSLESALEEALDDLHVWHDGLEEVSKELNDRHDGLRETYDTLEKWFQELQEYANMLGGLAVDDPPPYLENFEFPMWDDLAIPVFIGNIIVPDLDYVFDIQGFDDFKLPLLRNDFEIPQVHSDFRIPRLNNFSIPKLGDDFDMPRFGNDINVPTAHDLLGRIPVGTLPELKDDMSLDQLPHYDVPEFFETPPITPTFEKPPRPDDFWDSLDSLHLQLSSFNVDDFLSDDVQQLAAGMIDSFGTFLTMIGMDLDMQFELNINKLDVVRHGYIEHISTLRSETLLGEATEQERLRGYLDEVISANENNNENTHNRLSEFAMMIPESRTPAGMNRDLVDFTVAPLEFVSPEVRQAMLSMEPVNTQSGIIGTQSVVIIVAGAILAASSLSFVVYKRKHK